MKVFYYKEAGKNLGLHFYEISQEMKTEIKGFIQYNSSYLNAPHYDIVRPAQCFIQCEGDDYLFVEFWSYPEKHASFVELLRKEFNFKVLRREPR